jgi:hypothetical protein
MVTAALTSANKTRALARRVRLDRFPSPSPLNPLHPLSLIDSIFCSLFLFSFSLTILDLLLLPSRQVRSRARRHRPALPQP